MRFDSDCARLRWASHRQVAGYGRKSNLCADGSFSRSFHFTYLKTVPYEALSILGQWHQILSFLLNQIALDLSSMYQTAPELLRQTSKSRSDCDLAAISCRGQSYTRMFRRSITRPFRYRMLAATACRNRESGIGPTASCSSCMTQD